jgi:hypothetical protein
LTLGETEGAVSFRVPFVKVTRGHKVGMISASAVRPDMTFAICVSMVITALADFRPAGIFLAEWAARVKIHSSWKGFLFGHSRLECVLLLS